MRTVPYQEAFLESNGTMLYARVYRRTAFINICKCVTHLECSSRYSDDAVALIVLSQCYPPGYQHGTPKKALFKEIDGMVPWIPC